MTRDTRTTLFRALLVAGAAAVAGVVVYWVATAYFIHQAENNVRDLLLAQRGFHLYIQRVMHPTLYQMKERKEVVDDFYAPEIFSSSFIVREQHRFYNEAREEAGLPQMYYKMAATNPRNPVNAADQREADLIGYFNDHRFESHYSEVVESDGARYLYYATPFLPNTEACLKCHGRREDAPKDLQVRYPGPGGFNEKVGRIRAIESIRVPIQDAYRSAWVFSAALLAGLGALGSVVMTNRWLSRQVKVRTAHLEAETHVRRQAESALRFTQFAVDNLSDAAYWVRRDGAFAYTNDAASKALGYTLEELRTMRVWDIDPNESAATWDAVWKNAEERRSVVVSSVHRRKDGTTCPVEVMITYAEFSGAGYLLGVARDMTERDRLQAQLLHAQKMEAIGTLAGGIAHDFNNILTAILGYAELLSDDVPSGSPQREDIEEIRTAASRARDLVRQILTFSRKDQRSPQPIDVGAITKEALRLVRASIPATIEIRQSVAKDLWASADPTGLHQILMNLCTNAYHAMRASGGLLAVEVAAVSVDDHAPPPGVCPGAWIRLRVRDTGVGMDAATKARIFEPYFSTKGQFEGTGLGLSVVHGIVSGWGGIITVDSEPGKGATFDVYLKYAEQALEASANVDTSNLPRGSEKVLVVDDESAVLAVASRILGSLGYDVTTVESCEAAQAAMASSSAAFDIVVTDQTMPYCTGLRLAERLRMQRPTLPIILMTGFSEQVQSRTPADLGVSAIVLKPFNAFELATAVRSALGDRPPDRPSPRSES